MVRREVTVLCYTGVHVGGPSLFGITFTLVVYLSQPLSVYSRSVHPPNVKLDHYHRMIWDLNAPSKTTIWNMGTYRSSHAELPVVLPHDSNPFIWKPSSKHARLAGEVKNHKSSPRRSVGVVITLLWSFVVGSVSKVHSLLVRIFHHPLVTIESLSPRVQVK